MRLPAFLSLVVYLLSTVPGSAVEPIRIVATGGRIGYSEVGASGTITAFRHRTPHKLGGPVSEITLGFMNWVHTSKDEHATANATTLSFVWLERASTGQIVPVTFSGARQLVMVGSSTTSHYLSDPIPSSVWTGSAPVRDDLFWVHVKGSVPSGGAIPTGTPSTWSGAKFIQYDPVNDPGTRDTAGPVPAITGSTSRVKGLPLIFLGRFTGPGYLSVIGMGDSILDGTGDPQNPVPVVAGYGFFNRAAVDSNGANAIAMFNMTRHAETGGTWNAHHVRQGPLLQYGNVVVEEFGTNDLGSSTGTDPTNCINTLKTLWSTVRAAGIQKIVRTRLLPRTSSATYNWISKADQTVNQGWGVGGARDGVNAYFPTALSEGRIDVIVDTLSAVADPTDDHYWLTNGTNDYTTGDGTHPSWRGMQLLGVPLRSALLSLTTSPVTAPVVTSPGTASGTTGVPFNYQITSSNSPTSFGATSLPSGLSVNTSTGLISGTPTVAATSNVTISATNSAGTGTKSLLLTVTSPGNLPSPWIGQDIGTFTPAGSSSYSNGTFTLTTGNGLTLMDAFMSDAFTYVYQLGSGDCSITARVATLSCSDAIKGEGGVMIRSSLATSSPFALSGVTMGRGIQFSKRLTSGAANSSTGVSGLTAPYWVRVTRAGDSFTAYRSADNVTWTQVGTATTIAMGSSVYIGLVVCNHGSTGSATFSDVGVTP